nr:hemagglutinin repeat-containing protein [Paucibacter sp. KCTC 42545]
MAVQEVASSSGGGGSAGATGQTRGAGAQGGPARPWQTVAFAALCTIGLTLWVSPQSWAQGIQSAPTSASTGVKARPIVDAAANGVPVVHIVAPSTAGVSRNQFSHFNVDAQGLILNNSSSAVQPQLGGWIAANPQLGYVPARVIVNEVLGTQASQLKGVIEVAGRRADIVISNPNGLLVDGLGFTNAGRATLTTGLPTYAAQGGLQGFDVQQGQLQIASGGLNAAQLEQLDLFARNLRVEGEVWAQALQVVSGVNSISYARPGQLPTVESQANAGTQSSTSAPSFAIDIKDLGGMYARQIYLVSTERGLGVNSTGRLAALQGDLRLSSSGHLTLKDAYASQAMRLDSASDMHLSGLIQTAPTVNATAPGDLALSTAGDLTVTGRVESAGGLQVSSAGLDQRGTLVQHGSSSALDLRVKGLAHTSGLIASAGDLQLNAQELIDNAGQWQAQGQLNLSAQQLNLTQTQLTSGAATHLNANGGALVASDTRSNSLDLQLSAGTELSNTRGLWLAQHDVNVQGANISNRDGTFLANGQLLISSPGVVDNTGGKLLGASALQLQASGLINNASSTNPALIASDQTSSIQAAVLGNRGGVISGKSVLDIDARGQVLNNGSGLLVSDGQLSLKAGDLQSDHGQIVSRGKEGGTLDISARSLVNDHAWISAAGAAVLNLDNTFSNAAGTLSAGASGLTLKTATLQNDAGVIHSAGGLQLSASTLNNLNGAQIAAEGLGQIQTLNLNNQASLVSAAGLTLQANVLTNTGGSISSQGDLVLSAQSVSNQADIIGKGGGNIGSKGATISSAKALSITASSLTNRAEIASGQGLSITTGSLDNTQGRLSAQGDLSLHAAQVNNQAGRILSNASIEVRADGDLSNSLDRPLNNAQGIVSAASQLAIVSAGGVNNAQGQLLSGQSLNVHASDLDNSAGQVASANTVLELNKRAGTPGALINKSGQVIGSQTLTLSAAQIDNRAGKLLTGGDLTLDTRGKEFLNQAGQVSAGGKLSLAADVLDNSQGQLLGAQQIDLRATDVNNTAGEISSKSGRATLSLAGLNNGQNNGKQGLISSQGELQLNSSGTLVNAGTLSSDANTTVNAQTLDHSGLLQSGGTLRLNVEQGLSSTAGRIISAGDTELSAGSFSQSRGAVMASGAALTTSIAGTLSNTGASVMQSEGPLGVAAQTLINDSGTIASNAELRLLSADQLSNLSGRVQSRGQSELQVGSFNNSGAITSGQGLTLDVTDRSAKNQNTGGQIVSTGALVLQAGALDNSGGQVGSSAGTARVELSRLINGELPTLSGFGAVTGVNTGASGAKSGTKGLISSHGDLQLSVSGELLNAGTLSSDAATTVSAQTLEHSGVLQSGTHLRLNVAQALKNSAGRIISAGDIDLVAGRLTQSGGALLASGAALTTHVAGALSNTEASVIQSQGPLSVTTQALSNDGGTIVSNAALNLSSTGHLSNSSGSVQARGPAQLTVGSFNNSGAITSGQSLTLEATDSAAKNQSTGAKGLISSQGELQISSHGALLNEGTLNSDAKAVIKAQTLDHSGLLQSGSTLKLDVAQALSNSAGRILSAGDSDISAGSFAQSRGAALVSGAALATNISGALSNTGASAIQAQGPLRVTAQTVSNDGGAIATEGNLFLSSAGQLSNLSGSVQARGQAELTVGSFNNSGAISAAQRLTLEATDTAARNQNIGGKIVSAGALQLQAGVLDNTAGQIGSSGGAASLTLSRLNNGVSSGIKNGSAGLISSHGDLNLSSGELLNAGTLNSDAKAVVKASVLQNSGVLQSGAALNLDVAQALNNSGGSIISAGNTALIAGQLSNLNGRLQAGGQAAIKVSSFNNSGTISAGQSLNLEATDLSAKNLNIGGQIVSTGTLLLQGGALDNSGGQIGSSSGTASLTLTGLNNGINIGNNSGSTNKVTQGLISSHGDLQLISTGELINAGTLSSDAKATVKAQTLDLSGVVQSGSALSLNVAQALDSTGGRILSVGDTELSAGTLNQSQGAVLASGGALSASVARSLSNTGLSAIQAKGPLAVSAQSLSNDGSIATEGRLTLSSTGQLSNLGGRVQAGGQAELKVGSFSNSGSISAAQNLTLQATEISAKNQNIGGQIVSTGALVLQAGALDNSGGQIGSSAGSADLALTGLKNGLNKGIRGLISSHGDLQLISTGELLNAGTVSSDANTTVKAQTLDHSGVLQSGSSLSLSVTNAVNSTGGRILSVGDTELTAGSLAQSRGAVLASGAALTASVAGSLSNTGASAIQAKGPMTVSAQTLSNDSAIVTEGHLFLSSVGQLSNLAGPNQTGRIQAGGKAELQVASFSNSGVINAAQTLSLEARDLSAKNQNIGGQIVSTGALLVQAGALDNSGGQIGSSGGAASLTLTGLNNGINNKVLGLISSHGDLQLITSGDVLNAGTLSSDAKATIKAQHLDHSGLLQSGGALNLTVSQALNSVGGRIVSGGDAEVSADRLTQSHGAVLASGAALTTTIAGSLSNSGSSAIQAQGPLKLSTQTLSNEGATIATAGSLTLNNAGQLSNLGGTVQAGGQAELKVSSFNNSGAIGAGLGLTLEATDLSAKHQNIGGQIVSAGALQLQAGALDNTGGQIGSSASSAQLNLSSLNNSQGKLLGTTGLTLTASGEVTNTQGLIASNQALKLHARDFTNAQGTVQALGTAMLSVDSSLNNDRGVLTAAGTAELSAQTLSNRRGVIASQADLRAIATDLQNLGGQISALGAVKLDTQTLNNSTDTSQAVLQPGDFAGGQIIGGPLELTGQINNQGGRLISRADVRINSAGQRLVNDGGIIQAQGSLAVQSADLSNVGGRVLSAKSTQITAGDVDNSGGEISASAGSVNLRAKALNNGELVGQARSQGGSQGGVIYAQNTDSPSSATLTLTVNSLQNKGSVAALGGLSLTADHVDNQGMLQSGADAALQVSGALNNVGGKLVAANQFRVSAGSLSQSAGAVLQSGADTHLDIRDGVSNSGSSIGAGGNLVLKAASFTQDSRAQQTASLASAGQATLTLSGALNNQVGSSIAAMGELGVTADRMDNAGSIASHAALSLSASGPIQNSGTVAADQSLSILGGGLQNTGLISAQQNLKLDVQDGAAHAAGALVNHAGRIVAGGELQARAGSVDNSLGQWVSVGAMQISASSMNNVQGKLSSQGALSVNAEAIDNTQGQLGANQSLLLNAQSLQNKSGLLSSGAALTLNLTQDLSNDAGTIHSAQNADLTLGSLRTNVGGVIASNAGLTVQSSDTAAGRVNNAQGLLQAKTSLTLSSQSLFNDQGRILGGEALTVTAAQLSNGTGVMNTAGDASVLTLNSQDLSVALGGQLVSGGALKVNAQHSLINAGDIASAQEMLISSPTLLNSGRVQSGAGLSFTGQEMQNLGGQILAQGRLNIDAQNLSQTRQALLQSGGIATVHVSAALSNQDGSKLQTQGALDLSAASVDNSGGALASLADLKIKTEGLFQNAGGTVQAVEALSLESGSLDNRSGSISSRANVRLNTGSGSVNNQGGKVVAGGSLSAQAGELDNSGGSIASAEQLQVSATTLTNGVLGNVAGSLQSLKAATLHATAFKNAGGRVIADGALEVSAQNLDNTGGQIGSSYAGLNLTVSADLNNQRGQIASAQAAQLNLGSLSNNQSGSINSLGALTLNATGMLNTASGKVGAVGDLRVSSQALDNTQGQIGSSQGQVLIDTQGQSLLNDGGQILAANVLTIRSGTLSNQQHLPSAKAGVLRASTIDIVSTDFSNAGGLTAAVGTAASAAAGVLSIQAQQVNNAGGLLQSSGSMRLIAESLNNTLTNTSNNGGSSASGGLISAGDMTLNVSQSFNNQGGYVGAGGALAVNVGQVLDNSHEGAILASGAAAAKINAHELDNSAGGRIATHGNLDLTVAGTINNTGGQLASDGTLSVSADALINRASGAVTSGAAGAGRAAILSGSEGQAGTISAQIVNLGSQDQALRSFDNTGGKVTANLDLQANAQNLINDAGLLQAQNALTLNAPTLSNAGGTVIANQALTINTQSQSLAGSLVSASDLTLNISGDYNNTSNVSASRNLTLNATHITNSGTLHAAQDLTLSTLDATTGRLTNTGEISAGRNTVLTAGEFNNSGVVDASTGDTRITAATFSNKGAVYGTGLLIRASQSLTNEGTGALMSRGDMQLHAPSIQNNRGALIYADGNLTFGDGGAQTLSNSASRIEAGGHINFNNTAVSNLNVGLQTGTRTYTEAVNLTFISSSDGMDLCGQTWCDTSTMRLSLGDNGQNHRISGWVLPSKQYPFIDDINAVANGWRFITTDSWGYECYRDNECTKVYNYDANNPIWARLKVAAPTDLVTPAMPSDRQLDGCTLSDNDGGNVKDTTGACGTYWTALENYHSAFQARYDQLGSAIYAYNEDLARRNDHNWVERKVTQQTITETVVQDPGVQGQILAGGNIVLNGGSLLNSSSRVVAGGAITGNVESIVNQGVQGSKTVASSGTAQALYTDFWGGGKHSGIKSASDVTAYSDPGTTTTSSVMSYTYTELGGAAVNQVVGKGLAKANDSRAELAGAVQSQVRTEAVDGGNTEVRGVTQAQVAAAAAAAVLEGASQRAATHQSQVSGLNASAQVGVAGAAGPASLQQAQLSASGSASGQGPGAPSTAKLDKGTQGPDLTVPAIRPVGPNSPDQPGLADQTVAPVRPVRPDHPELPDGTVNPTRPGLADRPEPSVQPVRPGFPDHAKTPVQPVRPTQPNTPANIAQPEQQASSVSANLAALNSDKRATVGASDASAPGRTTTVGANKPQDIQLLRLPGTLERARDVILTTRPSLALPQNAVFKIDAAPGSKALVETDPRFTNYKTFVSSDYMLQQLTADPSHSMKRLGDGFYEQRQVADAILALTGQRFLSGYSDTQTEYQALMQAGVAFAKRYQLTPGVSLSPELMAQLTTDIVWLTTQTVTLADGSSQEVLVPQVYLRRPQSGDLQSGGALIAASSITLKSSGDIVNDNAALQSSGTLNVSAAKDLRNTGGSLRGQDLLLSAGQDLVNMGGSLIATGDGRQASNNGVLMASAGRDIILQTTTQTTASDFAAGAIGHTSIDRIATVQGGNVTLQAARDLLAAGAQVQASADLQGLAGRNLSVSAVQTSDSLALKLSPQQVNAGGLNGTGSYAQSAGTAQFGSQLSAEGKATLIAGAALDLKASQVSAGNTLGLQGASVNIAAGLNTQSSDMQGVHSSGFSQAAISQQSLSGGTLTAGKDLTVIAKTGDITLQGASLNSSLGAVQLSAANDLLVNALATQNKTSTASRQESSGLLSHSTQTSASRSEETLQNASTISGNTVHLNAGRDLSLSGSQVISDAGTQLIAGRDVSVVSAINNLTTSQDQSTTTSGLLSSGGIGFTVGTRKLSQERDHQGDSAAASTVASLGGDVLIQTGKGYTQTGSAVQALGGNVDILAQSVAITEAQQKATDVNKTAFTQSGLTLALSVPGLDGAMSAASAARQATQAEDPRMKALAAATAALKAIEAAKDLAKLAKDIEEKSDNKGISLSLTVGGSKATSQQTNQSEQGAGSSVTAGGRVNISAQGAGPDSNVLIRGSELSARNVQLSAQNQLSLQAAANSSSQQSDNQSVSGAAGLSIGLGEGSKDGFTANASMARGNSDGSDQSYANTHIKAREQVSLQSGGDTVLQGAVVQGQQVKADVGGDLKVQSLQDSAKFASKDQSLSGSVTVSPGSFSGSLSASQTQVSADFLSVAEQSGIKAGDGGFQVKVKGNTDLKGGVISSSQAAITDNKNSLSTGSLTASDLNNYSQYKAESVSLTVGTSVGSGNSAGAFKTSGDDSSTSKAGISQGQLTITHGDTSALSKLDRSVSSQSTGNGLQQGWDGQKLQEQAGLNAQIVQQFGSAASKAVGDRFKTKTDELKAQANKEDDQDKKQALLDEAKKWDEGGVYRVAAHAVVGGLTGNVGGAVGAGLSAASAPALEKMQAGLQDKLVAAGMSPEAAKGVAQLSAGAVAAAAGAAVGGVAGAAAGFNQDLNNRQLHSKETLRIKDLAKGDPQKEARLTAVACALVQCYAEYPEGSSTYTALKALADAGSSDAFAAERQQLQAQQGLFNYSTQGVLSDKNIDSAKQLNNTYQLTTRAVGAGQAVLGGLGVAASAATAPVSCATGIGCVANAAVATFSADAALTGAKQLVSGQPENTALNATLQAVGLSPEAASYAEAALGIGAAAKAGSVVSAATAQQAANSAAAKLSYEDISKFGAKGVNVTPEVMQTPQAKALIAEYQAAGVTADRALDYATDVLKTGNALPVVRTVSVNEELIKVVPKNVVGSDGVGAFSPYFMTRSEYDALSKLSPAEISQRLGLPAEQSVRGAQLGFEAYAIAPKPGTAPKVFTSTVAPVEQNAYKAVGGAQQTIVPNRSLWTEPKPIGTIGGNK